MAVHGKVVLYADDTAIFVSGKNIEDIQGKLNSDLERINAWLYANKLTLNAKKTMLFGTNQRLARLDTELSVTAGDIELEQVGPTMLQVPRAPLRPCSELEATHRIHL